MTTTEPGSMLRPAGGSPEGSGALSSVTSEHSGVATAVSAGPAGLTSAAFFGINFWPEVTGIGPYTSESAAFLAARGLSVTALTGLPSYPTWRVQDGYGGKLRSSEEHDGVAIRRLAHYVPQRQSVLHRGMYELTYLLQAMTSRLPEKPSVIIGVTPSLGGAVAAARRGRRLGVPVGIIVQDLMGQAAAQSGAKVGKGAMGILGRAEGAALRAADGIAIVSEGFRPHIESYGVDPTRITHLPNWSRVSASGASRDVTRDKMGWPRNATVVLHTGNMGLKQDLGNVVEAARLTQDRPDILWVLMGGGSQRAALEEQARGLANFRFEDPCDEDLYGDVLACADVLLLNERSTVDDMSLPSKMTSYFTSGRHVVAAVRLDGATARELRNVGGADIVAAGLPQALADAVTTRADLDPSALDRHTDRVLSSGYSRATALEGLWEFCEGLVRSTRSPA